MDTTLLAIVNLVAGYGSLEVLHGVSMSIAEGEAVALVGPNGAGKSTTLRTIMGLLPVTSGRIRFGKRAISGLRGAEIARTGIAIVPEGREVFPSLTVQENLIVGAWVRRYRKAETVFEEVYDLFPRLKERRLQRAGTLSGGEQQMLAVARGLVAKPRLLLVDEPSMGLAPIVVRDLYRVLQKVNASGTAILLVEQNVSRALGMCSRGYVMERGRIVLEGSSAELRADRRVREVYLGIASSQVS
jgi:branched-chain amino acid transport system ATP-binding protein